MKNDSVELFCSKCGISNLYISFRKNRPLCVKCCYAQNKLYRDSNKEKIKEQKKQFYKNNRELILQKVKEYSDNNKKKINKKAKLYRETHKEKYNEYKKIYYKNRYHNDISYKLRSLVASAIKRAITNGDGNKNQNSIVNYLDIKKIKNHLQEQFIHPDNLINGEPWMTWENWGKYNSKTWDDNDPETWTWQLDHIIPQSDLPYTSMEDENFKICWALENLRPYSAKQNIIDGPSRSRHKK